jgi:hypothetical protein
MNNYYIITELYIASNFIVGAQSEATCQADLGKTQDTNTPSKPIEDYIIEDQVKLDLIKFYIIFTVKLVCKDQLQHVCNCFNYEK